MSAHNAAVNLRCQTENKQFTSVLVGESEPADSEPASPLYLLTCFTSLKQGAFIRALLSLKALQTFTLFLTELHARIKAHVRRLR